MTNTVVIGATFDIDDGQQLVNQALLHAITIGPQMRGDFGESDVELDREGHLAAKSAPSARRTASSSVAYSTPRGGPMPQLAEVSAHGGVDPLGRER
jgi:hypothetical protein